MKKYNVAVIGYGWVSTAHIQAINATSHAQVTAVYSSRPQDNAELSARHGSAIQAYTNLDEMLKRSDIHAVSVCSYPSQHVQHAVAAAKAGKHIILEKPLTLSVEDTQTLMTAVQKAGVKTCVCFELRFSSQMIATKALVDSGVLGRLHYGEVDYYHGIGPWYGQYRWNTSKKDGGSSLISAGCHAMDALIMCMGEVESVSSYQTRSQNEAFSKYEYATTSVTILKFAGGRLGKVASVIDAIQPYYLHTHLVGSEGSLLDNKFHTTRIHGLNKHAWSTLSMKMADSGDVSDHPYQAQFESFFGALERGEEMPLTSLQESMRSHRAVLAADRSAELGREVKLKELE